MQYIVPSVDGATSILHALRCDFHEADQDELIFCRGGSRLEFHALDPTGLRLIEDVPIYGTIIALLPFKQSGKTTSSLAVLLASYRFFILAYNSESNAIETEAAIDYTETTAARPADLLQNILLDPQGAFLGIHAYNGLFRIVPLPTSESLESSGNKRRKSTTTELEEEGKIDLDRSYNIRLPDYNVYSLVLLTLESTPTLVILHDDANGHKILRSRPILLDEKDFSEDAIQEFKIEDEGSELLIPIPDEGVLVIGEARAVYIPLTAKGRSTTETGAAEDPASSSPTSSRKGKGKRRASEISVTSAGGVPSSPGKSRGKRRRVEERLPLEIYKSWVETDKDSFLLGDIHGGLLGLNLVRNSEGQVVGIETIEIGQVDPSLYTCSHF